MPRQRNLNANRTTPLPLGAIVSESEKVGSKEETSKLGNRGNGVGKLRP